MLSYIENLNAQKPFHSLLQAAQFQSIQHISYRDKTLLKLFQVFNHLSLISQDIFL